MAARRQDPAPGKQPRDPTKPATAIGLTVAGGVGVAVAVGGLNDARSWPEVPPQAETAVGVAEAEGYDFPPETEEALKNILTTEEGFEASYDDGPGPGDIPSLTGALDHGYHAPKALEGGTAEDGRYRAAGIVAYADAALGRAADGESLGGSLTLFESKVASSRHQAGSASSYGSPADKDRWARYADAPELGPDWRSHLPDATPATESEAIDSWLDGIETTHGLEMPPGSQEIAKYAAAVAIRERAGVSVDAAGPTYRVDADTRLPGLPHPDGSIVTGEPASSRPAARAHGAPAPGGATPGLG